MATITKKILVKSISQKLNIHSNDVKAILQAFFEEAIENFQEGNKLSFRDFGIFEVAIRKKKIARNPKKVDQVVIVPERRVVKFKGCKELRESLQKAVKTKEK